MLYSQTIEIVLDYFVRPMSRLVKGWLKYIKVLLLSLLFIKRLQKNISEIESKKLTKESITLFFSSLVLSTFIIAFIFFDKESKNISNRKEMLYQLIMPALNYFSLLVFLIFQGFVIRLIGFKIWKSDFSVHKYLLLLTYLVGGPILFYGVICSIADLLGYELGVGWNNVSLSITPPVWTGLWGCILIIIITVYLIIYLAPYVKNPKIVSFSILIIVWYFMLLGVWSGKEMVKGNEVFAEIKNNLTLQKVINTKERLVLITERNILETGRIAIEQQRYLDYLDSVFLKPFEDAWGLDIVTLFFYYKNSNGDPRPYVLSISRGPDRELNFTHDDALKILHILNSRSFSKVDEIDSIIDNIMKPYALEVVLQRNGAFDEKNVKTSWFGTSQIWSGVDLYRTMAGT